MVDRMQLVDSMITSCLTSKMLPNSPMVYNMFI